MKVGSGRRMGDSEWLGDSGGAEVTAEVVDLLVLSDGHIWYISTNPKHYIAGGCRNFS